ncbi:MAG TPA: HAD hydrolase-like protein [Candidatus Didemnitutus sp.]|nr:HAD hydrolase-like protein [Candidatus Didemnitutus sp.]
MTPALVLFDLDGTLVDSRPGIVHSLRLALSEMGVVVEEDHDFTWCIGASLWKIFEHYIGNADRTKVEAAVARYRHIYRDGPMFEYDVYDGVIETLQTLKSSNIRVAIATAKVHEYAREIIAVSRFAPYIDHVYGSELDGRNVEKRDLIHMILREERLQSDSVVMVGDRHHDVDGALANGVSSVAVLYGYGSAEELAHADVIVPHASFLAPAIASLNPPSR